jgi:hypothetical protein
MCPSADNTGLDQEIEYAEKIDTWVRQALSLGHTSWVSLVRSLPGVYPRMVRDSLERQGLASRIRYSKAMRSVSLAAPLGEGVQWEGLDLPTPHPLDSSWWFDTPTVRRLMLIVDELTAETAHVVLLGTPTLFAAARATCGTRSFTLVDLDPLTTQLARPSRRCFTTLCADITIDPIVLEPSSLVISDPPWYDAEIRSFLWTARQVCTIGGHVVSSFPPLGTRPGIEEQWEGFIEWTKELGLELCSVQHATLSYLSPLFEQNALRAASVPSIGGSWRRGDLAVFRCVDVCRCERPKEASGPHWSERKVGQVRIRLRMNGRSMGWADPSLISIAEGGILPSVSRRDPSRSRIDVWTSGNRVFACAGTWLLSTILSAIASGGECLTEVQSLVEGTLAGDQELIVRRVEGELINLIQVEDAELSEWRKTNARMDSVDT